MPLTMTPEREAEIFTMFLPIQGKLFLFINLVMELKTELDATRQALAARDALVKELQDKRITHLRCIEAMLDQIDSREAVEESDLADTVTDLSSRAVQQIRDQRALVKELVEALEAMWQDTEDGGFLTKTEVVEQARCVLAHARAQLLASKCPACDGTGSIPNGADEMACGRCTGTGKLPAPDALASREESK
jgi:hypothetical protein